MEKAQCWGWPPHAPQSRVTNEPPTVLITFMIPRIPENRPSCRSNYHVPVSVCGGEPAGGVLKLVKPAWVPLWAVMNLIIKVLNGGPFSPGPQGRDGRCWEGNLGALQAAPYPLLGGP